MTATREDIINDMVEATGAHRYIMKGALNEVISSIGQRLASGEKVVLRGLGTLTPYVKSGGARHNPKTLEKIEVGPSKKVRWRIAQSLKDQMQTSEWEGDQ